VAVTKPAPIYFTVLLPPHITFTLPGYSLPICSARPCGVGAGRRFSIIAAVFGCEERWMLGWVVADGEPRYGS